LPLPSLPRSSEIAQARAPPPPPRRAPHGVARRPTDRDGGGGHLRVEVPAVPEFSIFLDFSNGVIMAAGHCARCGSQTAADTCEVCGYRSA